MSSARSDRCNLGKPPLDLVVMKKKNTLRR